MAKVSANTFIGGGLLDTIYVAPKGTVYPVILGAPAGTYKDLGYLGEQGIEVSPNVDRKEFKAHQGGTIVRRKVTQSGRTFKFSLLEHSKAVLDVVNPGITTWLDTAGLVTADIPEAISTIEQVWVIDIFDTTYAEQIRLVFNGEATNTGSYTFGVEDMVAYEMELAAYGAIKLLTNIAQLVADV
jgi:hypothetical protein